MEKYTGNDGTRDVEINPEVPRVLVVDLSIRYGGASTRALLIAKHFLPGGGGLAGIEGSPVVRIAREQGVPVKIVGKKRSDPWIALRLARVIRSEGIQVVDTQNIQSKFWTSIAAVLVGFTFVSTLNSSYGTEFGKSLKGRFYHLLDLMTNWKTDRFVAVSELIKKDLVEDGVLPDKITIVRNAVEIPKWDENLDTIGIKSQFGLTNNGILCVLLGRLVWAKGYDDFISAFYTVIRRFNNTKAIIIGDGELRNEITSQIDRLGLTADILILGHQERSRAMQLLKAGDVFVMPSRSEGIPYALLEAAAIGKPIVATNCGGIPEVVENDRSALLVPVDDVESLGNAILLLCENRSYANKLGSAAQKKIAEEYSLERQMELLSETYFQTLRDKLR